MPAALRSKLGQDASDGLVEMFSLYHQFATDRFERRLIEETSALRVEMLQGFAALRQEMATTRVEWIKWTFLFWIGTLGIIVSVLGFALGG